MKIPVASTFFYRWIPKQHSTTKLLLKGLLFLGYSAFAQNDTLKESTTYFNQFYQTRPLSYATATGGFNNFKQQLLTEANLVHYFYLAPKSSQNWFFEVSPAIRFRMENKRNAPVQSPDYRARGTFYRQQQNQSASWLYFLGATHHSNGQSGDFYLTDTLSGENKINLKNGNFATNYFSFGGLWLPNASTNQKAKQALEVSLNYHLDISWTTEQDKRLDQFRLRSRWIIFNTKAAHSSKYLLMSALEIHLEDISTQKLSEGRSFAADVQFSYQPKWMARTSFWFFAQAYYGSDYYNIYFNESARFLRVGISAQAPYPNFLRD